MSVFTAVMLINHVALLRVHARDSLAQSTLTCTPLCAGLLCGIAVVMSATLQALISPHIEAVPSFHILHTFVNLIITALVVHLLCALCYRAKPLPVISQLFPIVLLTSIGLSWVASNINIDFHYAPASVVVAGAFIIVSTLFYYLHLRVAQVVDPDHRKPLSALFLVTALFLFYLFGLINFH